MPTSSFNYPRWGQAHGDSGATGLKEHEFLNDFMAWDTYRLLSKREKKIIIIIITIIIIIIWGKTAVFLFSLVSLYYYYKGVLDESLVENKISGNVIPCGRYTKISDLSERIQT